MNELESKRFAKRASELQKKAFPTFEEMIDELFSQFPGDSQSVSFDSYPEGSAVATLAYHAMEFYEAVDQLKELNVMVRQLQKFDEATHLVVEGKIKEGAPGYKWLEKIRVEMPSARQAFHLGHLSKFFILAYKVRDYFAWAHDEIKEPLRAANDTDWPDGTKSKEHFVECVQRLGPAKRRSDAEWRKGVLRKFAAAHFAQFPGNDYDDLYAAAQSCAGDVCRAIESYKNGESLRKAVGGVKRIAQPRSKR